MILNITYFQTISILLTITCCLVFFLVVNYQKTKPLEISKLNYLFLELKKEKIVSDKLKTTSLEINKIESKTQLKLNRLNVSVLNISFSLKEAFK